MSTEIQALHDEAARFAASQFNYHLMVDAVEETSVRSFLGGFACALGYLSCGEPSPLYLKVSHEISRIDERARAESRATVKAVEMVRGTWKTHTPPAE